MSTNRNLEEKSGFQNNQIGKEYIIIYTAEILT